MATYIKRFDTTTEYTTYMAGDPYLPNVSMCEDIIDSPSMHYTPFIPVSGVTLDKSEASVTVNGSTTLTATILPLDASKKAVTWSSSDTSKVTIDGSGSTVTLNCIGIGSSTITCTSVSDPSISATCSVTVTAIAVTGITLSSSSITHNIGETRSLTATIIPSNATNKNVTWSSSDTSKVTVTPNGTTATLNFVGAGRSIITCASVSDPSISATCSVTVTVKSIAVTGITLSSSSKTLNVGETAILIATITPSNATNKMVNWKSSNPSVARVVDVGNGRGNITGYDAGTATITATSDDNPSKKATCAITVTDRYQVTVTTDVYTNKNYSGKYVVTDAHGLYDNNLNYNLTFDRNLVEGDKIRIVGKVVDEYYFHYPDDNLVIKSFDMQGTVPTAADVVVGDEQTIVCMDEGEAIITQLLIGDGNYESLYGYISTPYLAIDSETPYTDSRPSFLDYNSLEIYVNDEPCIMHYQNI